eukprot:gb/GECG01009522.1/.p1 GENE.gb/GECG01009522.1/~~gb/GECG01009522.1/.p1  ORF type:complete len:2380 (+),score=280.36 gb/GECG01009522.1/:1-7140(+)
MIGDSNKYCPMQTFLALESLTGVSQSFLQGSLGWDAKYIAMNWKELTKSEDLASSIVEKLEAVWELPAQVLRRLLSFRGDHSTTCLNVNEAVQVYINPKSPVHVRELADDMICAHKNFRINDALSIFHRSYPFHSAAVVDKMCKLSKVQYADIIGTLLPSDDFFASWHNIHSKSRKLVSYVNKLLADTWGVPLRVVQSLYNVYRKEDVPSAVVKIIIDCEAVPICVKAEVQRIYITNASIKDSMSFAGCVQPLDGTLIVKLAAKTKLTRKLVTAFFDEDIDTLIAGASQLLKVKTQVAHIIFETLSSKWKLSSDIICTIFKAITSGSKLPPDILKATYKAENVPLKMVVTVEKHCLDIYKCFQLMRDTHPFQHKRVLKYLKTLENSIASAIEGYLDGEFGKLIYNWQSLYMSPQVAEQITNDVCTKWAISETVLKKTMAAHADISSKGHGTLCMEDALHLYDSRCPEALKEIVDKILCTAETFDVEGALTLFWKMYPSPRPAVTAALFCNINVKESDVLHCLQQSENCFLTSWISLFHTNQRVLHWVNGQLSDKWQVAQEAVTACHNALNPGNIEEATEASIAATKQVFLSKSVPTHVKEAIAECPKFSPEIRFALVKTTFPLYYRRLVSLLKEQVPEDVLLTLLQEDMEKEGTVIRRWKDFQQYPSWVAEHMVKTFSRRWNATEPTTKLVFDALVEPPLIQLDLSRAVELYMMAMIPFPLRFRIARAFLEQASGIVDYMEFIKLTAIPLELLKDLKSPLADAPAVPLWCFFNRSLQQLRDHWADVSGFSAELSEYMIQSLSKELHMDATVLDSVMAKENLELKDAVRLMMNKHVPSFLVAESKLHVSAMLSSMIGTSPSLEGVGGTRDFSKKDIHLKHALCSQATFCDTTDPNTTTTPPRNRHRIDMDTPHGREDDNSGASQRSKEVSRRPASSSEAKVTYTPHNTIGFPLPTLEEWKMRVDFLTDPVIELQFACTPSLPDQESEIKISLQANKSKHSVHICISKGSKKLKETSVDLRRDHKPDDALEVKVQFKRHNVKILIESRTVANARFRVPMSRLHRSLVLSVPNRSTYQSLVIDCPMQATSDTRVPDFERNVGSVTCIKHQSHLLWSLISVYVAAGDSVGRPIRQESSVLETPAVFDNVFNAFVTQVYPRSLSVPLEDGTLLLNKLVQYSLVVSFGSYLRITDTCLFSPLSWSFAELPCSGNMPQMPLEILRDNKPELCHALLKHCLEEYSLEYCKNQTGASAIECLQSLTSTSLKAGSLLSEQLHPIDASFRYDLQAKRQLFEAALAEVNAASPHGIFGQSSLSQLLSQDVPEANLIAMLSCLNSEGPLKVHSKEYLEAYRSIDYGEKPQSVLICLAASRQLRVLENNIAASLLLLKTFVMIRCIHQVSSTDASNEPPESLKHISLLDFLNNTERKLLLHGADNSYGKMKTSVEDHGSTSPPITSDAKNDNHSQYKAYPNLQRLLKMIGLDAVKECALEIVDSSLTSRKLPRGSRITPKLHFAFVGNSGTGKTTAAMYYGKLLMELNLRDIVRQVSASKLKRDGAKAFEKLVMEARYDVLIIEDAHLLDPMGDSAGTEIVNELLDAAEKHKETMSIILTGKKENIESKLYEYDTSMISHFQEVTFHNFTEQQLRELWEYELETNMWKVSEPFVTDVVVRKLSRRCGTKTFANAREVRNVLERAFKRATKRTTLDFKNPTLVVQDILGPPPTRATLPDLNEALVDLDKLTGLTKVKKEIHDLVNLATDNYQRELEGLPIMDVTMNRLMLGNPGTGKTTVAKIYARILKALGLVSKADVELRTAADFIGGHVGETQRKTSAILEMAEGKVLLIDEAYCLNDTWYGTQAIDTIVGKVMGCPGEDIAVLMCGYDRQMRDMLRDQNPGLARRFNPSSAFIFDDYDDAALATILQTYCTEEQLTLSLPVLRKAVEHLRNQRQLGNFGNAGAVRNLLSVAKVRMNARIRNAEGSVNPSEKRTLSVEDIGPVDAAKDIPKEGTSSYDPLAPLRALQGSDYIVRRLESERKHLEVQRREGRTVTSRHYIYVGSPGTGKTTVARCMGQMLKDLQLILRAEVIETTAADLCGSVIGEAKELVKTKLAQARGGVLFIDEAYQLGKGTYGLEALAKLVELMTAEEYADKTVIIIAGYRDAMHDMLRRNSGLRSRFTEEIEFPDWTAKDCTNHFLSLAEKDGFVVETDAAGMLESSFEELRRRPGWANARDSNTCYHHKVLPRRSERAYAEQEAIPTITCDDVRLGMKEFLEERVGSPPTSLAEKFPFDVVMNRDEEDEENIVLRPPRHNIPAVQEGESETENQDQNNVETNKQGKEDGNEDEEQRRQEKLKRLGKCPMSYSWTAIGNGYYRCEGGSHYIHESEIE